MKTLLFSKEALSKAKRIAQFRRYAFFVNKIELCSPLKKLHISKLLFVMFVGCFSMTALGQTASISGIVIDNSGEDPLIGATIYIEELKTGTMAERNGEFVINGLTPGNYTISVSYIGYNKHTESIKLEVGERLKRVFRLNAETQSLAEVVVTAKSEARLLREQAMPVSVISMNQLQGTVSSVQDILAKTVGVTVRTSGGVGSASRLSVRGLEGKRIGFFLDETPINDYSDFVDLNDIPIDMIDRIEIYKGVVPAKFGGSAMGGAVNIVLREYPERYADISYKRASFNANDLQTVLKRNFIEQGIVLGLGGGYTYADNDYTMESPYIKGLKIKRNHDKFKKLLIGGSLKARKWWFDEVEFEPAFINVYREIQGIETDIREANITSRIYLLNNILKKDDFLTEGLDLDVTTSVGYTQYQLVDTAKAWYDWDGVAYPTISLYGGELGNRFPSFSNNKKVVVVNKLNLEYTVNKHHSLSINSFFSIANGYPSDTLKELSMGKKVDFNSKMRSWVSGITHNFRTEDDKFLNSFTFRYYLYTMQTKHQNFYVSTPPEDINLHKSSFGVSNALRYRFTPDLLGKLSAGYDVRIPSETELLGDGYSIAPSERLMPERNTSVNIGLMYDLTGRQRSNLQLEVNAFYMHLNDMIRFVKGILGAQYQNFGKMRTLGVEFEAKADIFSFLYGYGNVTFQDLRDIRQYEENSTIPNPTKNKRMPNIPYLMANAGLEFHKENLFGGKEQNSRFFTDMAFVEEYLYDFELTENTKRRLPRSLTFDIGFEHSFMNQRLFLSGKINNITNAKVLSEFNRPLPGRNFRMKLRYVFR